MNVRGLQDNLKRKEMFLYINKMKFNIVLMQETHSAEECEIIWNAEWGQKIIYSHGCSNARGVAILFKRNVEYEIKKVTRDDQGRFIVIDCVIDNQKMMIANVYAPNNDDPNFFMMLCEAFTKHEHSERIIAGDFNLVLDTHADSMNRKNNNVKALKVVEAYMEEILLVDTWRLKKYRQVRVYVV